MHKWNARSSISDSTTSFTAFSSSFLNISEDATISLSLCSCNCKTFTLWLIKRMPPSWTTWRVQFVLVELRKAFPWGMSDIVIRQHATITCSSLSLSWNWWPTFEIWKGRVTTPLTCRPHWPTCSVCFRKFSSRWRAELRLSVRDSTSDWRFLHRWSSRRLVAPLDLLFSLRSCNSSDCRFMIDSFCANAVSSPGRSSSREEWRRRSRQRWQERV